MERTNRGFASTQTHRNRPDEASGRRCRPDKLNPTSRQVNRSLRAAEFDHFARSIHRDLNPRGPLEHLVTRHAVRSAWRLKNNLDDAVGMDEVSGSPDADRAARALEVAITTLDLLQGRRGREPGDTAASGVASSDPDFAPPADQIEPNEWPIVPPDETDPDLDLEAADDEPIWRDRLVYDFDVSDHSPVIQGTWITVSHVVSLIIDGATWADILRTHPELAEDDIRVCVAYAVAEEDASV